MNLKRAKTPTLVISGLPRIDPITVFTEDLAPGRGHLTVTCFGRAWSCYWGGMSGRTVAQFVASCNSSYVVDNLIRGMGQRVAKSKKHEDAYLTRIVEAVQAAFRELETPAKRREQLVRLEHANALIKAISDHGRRFFWNENDVRLARLELDPRGRVWFHDDYQGKRVYTHDTGGRWRGFSHGGTLRNLVILMRDYVTKGTHIHPGYICTRQLGNPEENVWGYDKAAAEATRAAALALPIIATTTPVLP